MLKFYCLKFIILSLINNFFLLCSFSLPSSLPFSLPSVIIMLNNEELTMPVSTKLHDSGFSWSSWERSVLTTPSLQNSLTRGLSRAHTGTKRSTAGRYQYYQRQIPKPNWSMAFSSSL